jgi:glycine/D-amino acid oxidase-like deaminating enzyme
MLASPSDHHHHIVIIGGGIIGCTTAYYLTHHPSFSPITTTLTLIEASAYGIGQGASGKAGGLVANWAEPLELARVSFSEHVRLAAEFGGEERWGFRFVECATWEGRGELANVSATTLVEDERDGQEVFPEKQNGDVGKHPENLAAVNGNILRGIGGELPAELRWVKEELTDFYEAIAPEGTTAQVHPYLFTSSMFELALLKGLRVISGRATSINHEHGVVTGVTYTPNSDDGTTFAAADTTPSDTTTSTAAPITLPATHVILAAGAWSSVLIPELGISGARTHSITIHPDPDSTLTPHVLFASISLPGLRSPVTPEIYPRPGLAKEVYACGPPDDHPLPACVDEVEVDDDACACIHEHVGSISEVLREGTVMAKQACYMPMTAESDYEGQHGPILGEASAIAKGLFVAAGHSCWVSLSLLPSPFTFCCSVWFDIFGYKKGDMQCTWNSESVE